MVKGSNHTHPYTRREFSILAATALSPGGSAEPPRVLIVVAHPDDEYAVAATVYRLTKHTGAVVDQVVITDGEGGFRYAALAEHFYGLPLAEAEPARTRLPQIRRRETLAAGKILGIRNHHFLGERDNGFTLEAQEAHSLWDMQRVENALAALMAAGRYQYIFTMMPTESTHGHHKTAAHLALKAAAALPSAARPAVLGAEAGSLADGAPQVAPWSGKPFEVSRKQRFGYGDALDYAIVVTWVIAEHKSQGLFQTDAGKHDVERFWAMGPDFAEAERAAQRLFGRLAAAGQERRQAPLFGAEASQ